MTQPNDIKSISRVFGGNPDAFEDIVKKYKSPLFVYIGNIIQHRETAEDILQDVFLAAYTHLGSYHEHRGKFSTWLFRIARNKCFNELKRKKELSRPDLFDLPDQTSPADELLKKEMFLKLNKALSRLPFKDLSIFILAEFDGLSYLEISEIEKIRMGTVKSRLSRTRKKLKAILQKQEKI